MTVDADGFTTIVDRVKELIITGGFNVAPSEVEAVLRQHPNVTDAAAIGHAARVAASVWPPSWCSRPAQTLDEAALRDFCRERLAGYKVPTRIVAVDDLPRSMLGKVLRKQVRDLVVPML